MRSFLHLLMLYLQQYVRSAILSVMLCLPVQLQVGKCCVSLEQTELEGHNYNYTGITVNGHKILKKDE